MVVIKKRNRVYRVSMGAYNNQFKHLGYKIVGSDKETEKTEQNDLEKFEKAKPQDEEIADEFEQENDSETDEDADPEDDEETDEDEEDEDESEEEPEDEDDLSEKPLSKMNMQELEEYAERLGVETDGLRSKKEVREAIKKAM